MLLVEHVRGRTTDLKRDIISVFDLAKRKILKIGEVLRAALFTYGFQNLFDSKVKLNWAK